MQLFQHTQSTLFAIFIFFFVVIFVNSCFHFVAFLVVTSLWTLSLFERVRAVPQPSITVEQLLLAV